MRFKLNFETFIIGKSAMTTRASEIARGENDELEISAGVFGFGREIEKKIGILLQFIYNLYKFTRLNGSAVQPPSRPILFKKEIFQHHRFMPFVQPISLTGWRYGRSRGNTYRDCKHHFINDRFYWPIRCKDISKVFKDKS
ncbi:hypothetical protein Salat_1485000 [Sesamum alatum]|uniref:Uncharacterized protein n=1 Tax=Sesamum alatum TaxID=300844 RepID=A0AAE2CM19_9LAMI|nr:hypothetical protein Salat_1485000 [Sesamum alatum]